MKRTGRWMFLILCSISWSGCSEDPNPVTCEGGACERQEQCLPECEDVCGDPDFGSYECVEERCLCECFFGCR